MAGQALAKVIPFSSMKNLQGDGRFPPASPPPSPPASASPSSPYPISPSTFTPLETPSTPPTLPALQLTLGAVGESVPTEKKRAKKAPKAPTPEGTRHRRTIDLFVRLWSEIRGGTYVVIGGRDGTSVKRLLRIPEATDAEIERRMRRALADPWFQRAGSLAVFVSRWSNYDRDAAPVGRAAGPAQSTGASRRVVGLNADGSFRYA
jgi:hypothetical protein